MIESQQIFQKFIKYWPLHRYKMITTSKLKIEQNDKKANILMLQFSVMFLFSLCVALLGCSFFYSTLRIAK